MKIFRVISTALMMAFFIFGNASFAKDKEPTMISVDMPAMFTQGGGYFSCTIVNHTGRQLEGVNIIFHKYDETEQRWEIEESPFIGLLANGDFHRDNESSINDTVYCRFRYLGFEDDTVSLSMCFLDPFELRPVTCFSN